MNVFNVLEFINSDNFNKIDVDDTTGCVFDDESKLKSKDSFVGGMNIFQKRLWRMIQGLESEFRDLKRRLTKKKFRSRKFQILKWKIDRLEQNLKVLRLILQTSLSQNLGKTSSGRFIILEGYRVHYNEPEYQPIEYHHSSATEVSSVG